MTADSRPKAPHAPTPAQPWAPARDRATLNFRYFLPWPPQWGDAAHCERRLAELLAFCTRARVDAVQFYVNTRSSTYYMPAPSADSIAGWAAWMRDTVAPAVRAAGLSFQLNLQCLLGMTTQGADLRGDYDWEFLVAQDGREAPGCACPLGPRFRAIAAPMLRLWADTRPDVLWVDDDFRLHNHGLDMPGGDYYCFCPTHLAAFSRHDGREWTRDGLVAELLRPGDPSPVRARWMDFLGETMVEAAGWVRGEIHAVAPGTRIALMTSSPEVHSAEGRDWAGTLGAFSGPHRPMTRPCCAIYSGTLVPVKAQAAALRFMASSIAVVGQAVGRGGADFGPELENTRYTTWAKSGANTRFMLVLGQVLGCPQITLATHDLEGTPLNEEPTIAPLLAGMRAPLDALAALELDAWEPAGLGLVSDPLGARKTRLDAAAPGGRVPAVGDLAPARDWDPVLLPCAIPPVYLSPAQAAEFDGAVALDTAAARCLDNAQLGAVLRRAALLDAGAASVIEERGLGALTGVRAGDWQPMGVVSEEFSAEVLPGVDAARTPHRGARWRLLEPAPGARVASWYVDAAGRRCPGTVVFENAAGGRIVVSGQVGDVEPHGVFGSHARLRWLHGALAWITRGAFPVLATVPHHAIAVCRRRGQEWFVAIGNLGTDPLERVTLTLPAGPAPADLAAVEGPGLAPVTAWSFNAETSLPVRLMVETAASCFSWLVLRFRRP